MKKVLGRILIVFAFFAVLNDMVIKTFYMDDIFIEDFLSEVEEESSEKDFEEKKESEKEEQKLFNDFQFFAQHLENTYQHYILSSSQTLASRWLDEPNTPPPKA